MTDTIIHPQHGVNDVCRILNLMDREWTGMYNSQSYKMPPGGETIAPYIAVCNWFGHPDAVDVGPRERYRTDEYARLRVFYGVYDDEDRWDELTPKVEVYDLEGNRIITVIDDPSGAHLSPTQTTVLERDNLTRQLAQMDRQMRAMQAQLDQQNRAMAAEDAGDIINPDDAPVNPNVNPNVIHPDDPSLIVEAQVAKQRQAGNEQVTEDTPTRIRVSS